MQPSYYTNKKGVKLAYVHSPASGHGLALPAVIFLGGFKSDMNGSKALYFEDLCRVRSQEYLRFDYTGHGLSGGAFTDGTIGRWLDDAREMLCTFIDAPEIVVIGSSMGGWLALRLLMAMPEGAPHLKGVIGIAAAPDFTREIKAALTPAQKEVLEETGRFEEFNEYSDEPYIFTRALLDEGEAQCLLEPEAPYKTDAFLTLLQGKADNTVPWKKALHIKDAFMSTQNIDVIFIDDGDHGLSRPCDLEILGSVLVKTDY